MSDNPPQDQPPVVPVDANNDGIPDHLQRIVEAVPRLVPSWDNRRRVIYAFLIVLASVYIGIALCVMAALVAEGVLGLRAVIDSDIAEMVQTLLWTTSLSATGIIGAYCGFSNMDSASFRSTMSDLAGKIVRPRQ